MSHCRTTILIGTLLMCAGQSLGQLSPPEKARLTTWASSGTVTNFSRNLRDPTKTVPLTWDTSGDTHPDEDKNENGSTFTAQTAAHALFQGLVNDVNGGWVTKENMAVFIRNVGIDLPGGNDAATTARGNTWGTRRTFFVPNDRLPGHVFDGPGTGRPEDSVSFPQPTPSGVPDNRTYRHPFLLNATAASPLRQYMIEWASQLRHDIDTDPAGATSVRGGNPSFYFDEESSHIIQIPSGNNQIFMLWYLTTEQAKVTLSNGSEVSIWRQFKVPGSPGWNPATPPSDSELNNPNASGFSAASTSGQTLEQMYLAEAALHADPVHWPLAQSDLSALLFDPSRGGHNPEEDTIRPVILWWQQVCNKAEAQVWENAIFDPLNQAFPNARMVNYQFTTVDSKVDNSATVHDIGSLPTPDYPDYDRDHHSNDTALLTENLPRGIFWTAGSDYLWKTGGALDSNGVQRRWGFLPATIQGTQGRVAERVMDSPEFYFHEGLDYFYYNNVIGLADRRGARMENPSLPTWAQVSPTIASQPTQGTHDYFRWRESVLFQNMLGFRHTAESSINSDHLTTTGVKTGNHESQLLPWMWQELPTGVSADELIVEWTRRWSARIRSCMAMLRAKASPEWAIFMSPAQEGVPNTLTWGTLWFRSAQQRDEVFTSLVTDYNALTGSISESGLNNPHDADRLNFTLRKIWGTNPDPTDYTANNTSTQPIVADPGHDAPSGRMTRTEVSVTLFPYPWAGTCGPLPLHNNPTVLRSVAPGSPTNEQGNPIPDGDPDLRQLAGSYEINIETSAGYSTQGSDGLPVSLMVEVYNYALGRWDILPLEPLDDHNAPIFTAPMRELQTSDPNPGNPSVYHVSTKTRRTYLLKEPQFIPNSDTPEDVLTAQYTLSTGTGTNTRSQMLLKIVQVMPSGLCTSLDTSLDLVQVVPLCVYDNYTDNVYVPRPATSGGSVSEAIDAGLATAPRTQYVGGDDVHVTGAYPVPIDPDCMVNPISQDPTFQGVDFENPGPIFLSSAFCHTSPSGSNVSLTNSGGQPIAPGTLFIELPSWVRVDASGADPLYVWKYDSNVDPTDSTSSVSNPYAQMMSVEVRNSTQAGRSSVIAVSGLTSDNNSLMEGTYILRPNRNAGGLVIDSDVAPSEPVADFEVRFSILSDCNTNSIPDGCEIAHQLDANGGSYLVDIFPTDGKLDACHPDDCDPDYTADGGVDQGDVDALIGLIAGTPIPGHPYADPDFNHDGSVDQGDVDSLVNTIASGSCPNE